MSPSRVAELTCLLLAWGSIPGGAGCAVTTPRQATPEALRVEVIAAHPHDPRAFTQGLVWDDGTLFESTGLRGQSSVRRVDLQSGEVLQQVDLEPRLFGEGLAAVGGRLIVLTWQSGVASVHDRDSLRRIGVHTYVGEGWGLCMADDSLIMSDGSDRLHFHDPETFESLGSLAVTVGGEPQRDLNELEFAGGFIYANVWGEDRILKIDPMTGVVVAEIDASGLLTSAQRLNADVLNGIAWNAQEEVFYLTGKLWPSLFEVRFVPAE
jgi:glutaminyl-peptide cyclotransferase